MPRACPCVWRSGACAATLSEQARWRSGHLSHPTLDAHQTFDRSDLIRSCGADRALFGKTDAGLLNMMEAVIRLISIAVLGLLWTSVEGTAQDSALDKVERGRKLSVEHCSRCHAIGKNGPSQFHLAPPFRDIVKRYPTEQLEEALAEGIVTGHPAMPRFVFNPDEIDALLSYMDQLHY